MDDLDRARLLIGTKRAESSAGSMQRPTQTTTVTGVATSDSSDGYVSVDMGGDTVSQDDDQSITIPTTVRVEKGDTVRISLVGSDGTAKSPTVVGVIGGGDRTYKQINAKIDNVDVQYAQNSSATTAPTSGWSTTAPTWVDGLYIWSRTATTTASGTTYSDPVCITGAKGTTGDTGANGKDGATGIGVSAIVEQYYLSTSSTSCAGGSWSTTCPTWSTGHYIWTRSVITWTNNTTSYTDPVLAAAINQANEAAAAALPADDFTRATIFNTLTTDGSMQGWFFGKMNADGSVTRVDPANVDASCDLYINASYVVTGILKSLNYVEDTSGMCINLTNGLINSKNFEIDENGNVTVSGNINLTGTQVMRIHNASGTEIGNITFTTFQGQDWSPGALQLHGYDLVSLETGDTSTSKAMGYIRAGDDIVAEFGSETSGTNTYRFFGIGSYGDALTYYKNIDTSTGANSEGLKQYGIKMPIFSAGSKVVTCTGIDAVLLFTSSQISSLLGAAPGAFPSAYNTTILICNGDADAAAVHTQGVNFIPQTNEWYATFDRTWSAPMRINYLIVYFG